MSRNPENRRTLFRKVWDAHLVADGGDDAPSLLYVDLHLVHEVTSPQAFEALRVAGRPVRFAGELADDAFGETRLRAAFAQAGFGKIDVALEPEAAGYRFARTLRAPATVLVGDFGDGQQPAETHYLHRNATRLERIGHRRRIGVAPHQHRCGHLVERELRGESAHVPVRTRIELPGSERHRAGHGTESVGRNPPKIPGTWLN